MTGGRGFLGSHLVRRLVLDGWAVHATSRHAMPDDDQVRWHVSDLHVLQDCERLLDEATPDVVFHLAGAVGAGYGIENVAVTFHSHAVSALNIMTAAHSRSIGRVVIAGSMLEPLDAAKPIVPSSPYAAAKFTATMYARMFRHLYGLPVVVPRVFMTFGPNQDPTKVLPYVIRSLRDATQPVIRSGSWKADWIYVDDVVDGLIRSALVQKLGATEFDLGRGELTSIRSMVGQIVSLMGSDISADFGADNDRPGEPERLANPLSAKRALSWAPMVSLEDGLRRTIDYYCSERSGS